MIGFGLFFFLVGFLVNLLVLEFTVCLFFVVVFVVFLARVEWTLCLFLRPYRAARHFL